MGNLFNNNYGASTPDKLFAGITHPADIKGITILAGQGIIARGTVIGIVTVGGKGKIVDSTNTDGSEVADCILTDEIDTTGGDIVTSAYTSGEFNRGALIFGGTDRHCCCRP